MNHKIYISEVIQLNCMFSVMEYLNANVQIQVIPLNNFSDRHELSSMVITTFCWSLRAKLSFHHPKKCNSGPRYTPRYRPEKLDSVQLQFSWYQYRTGQQHTGIR